MTKQCESILKPIEKEIDRVHKIIETTEVSTLYVDNLNKRIMLCNAHIMVCNAFKEHSQFDEDKFSKMVNAAKDKEFKEEPV